MKLEQPKNKNYCATVFKIKTITPLENCDNVVAVPILGLQAIVSKNTNVGDIGILLPAESQLSEEYCRENNLFRHSEKNKDTDVKGYLEDNRRVKAVKFRGHRSDALFMPLESLSYLGVQPSDFKERDEFDAIKDKEVCRKYVIEQGERKNRQPLPKTFKRVDTKFIPEHFDSDNYFKLSDQLNPEADIIVTQKIHGTSIRIGNTIVLRRLMFLERIVKLLGAKIKETEFDYVFGSRKVIKDINSPYQNHYYGEDIWTHEGKKLEGLIPENFILYGELIGWTPTGSPIQADYTYRIPKGACELYVYRVAFVNGQGIVTDLSWDHVKEFCHNVNIKVVPELWRGKVKDFDVNNYMDKRFNDEHRQCLPLDEGLVDEGVCIRVDKIVPYILKAKAPLFLQHESKVLDSGVQDLESQESVESPPSSDAHLLS